MRLRSFCTLSSLVLLLASPARSQEAAPKEGASPPADASPTEGSSTADKRTSVELRFIVISAAGRWSAVDSMFDRLELHAKRSVYFGPGIGVRVFIKQPHHGLLVDFDYMVDTDIDSVNKLSVWKTDFAVARVGYAYRFFRHANDKMTWAFTPHASFSAGGTINRDEPNLPGPIEEAFSARSAVIGGRIGVNVDLHINRFMMGWAVAYEGLKHISGAPLGGSHLLKWTLIPVFRIGVDLGPKIQSL